MASSPKASSFKHQRSITVSSRASTAMKMLTASAQRTQVTNNNDNNNQQQDDIIISNNTPSEQEESIMYNDNDIITGLRHLQRHKTQRDVESAIVKLGRQGRTNDALQLYHAVWALDTLRYQYRLKIEEQKKQLVNDDKQENGSDNSANEQQQLQDEIKLQINSIKLPADITTYIISTKANKYNTIRPTTRLMNSAIDACSRMVVGSSSSSSSSEVTSSTLANSIFQNAISPYNPIINSTQKKIGGALSPNIYTFGSLLSCYSRNEGQISNSLELLETLEKGEVYPDVIINEVIYSTVISSCERAQVPNVKLALEVLNRGILNLSSTSTTGSESGDSGSGDKKKKKKIKSGQMGVVGYNTVISTMAKSKEWKLAIRLLGEMILHSQQQQSSTTSDDVEEDGTSGVGVVRSNSLFERFEEIRTDDINSTNGTSNKPLLKIPPNNTNIIIIPKPDEVTFGTVLAACEKSGEWEELLHVAKAATEYGVKLDGLALTSVLHSCQQLGLADDALEYLELMKRLGDNDNNNDGEGIKGGDRDTQGRKRKGAKQTLMGPDSVAYRLAISACARAPGGHRWMDGISLLDEMRQLSIQTNRTDYAPDVVAYTAAIAGCSEAGEYTHAMSLISQMRKEGIKPNVVTFSAVINACASASAKMARKFEDQSVDSSSNNRATLEDVRMPMNRALRLLEAMQSPTSSTRPNIVTYNAAIRACAEGLNLQGAFDLLKQLKEDGLEPTIVTYGSLMTACERVGDIEAASKVFRMVKEEEEKYKDDEEEADGQGKDDNDRQERLQVNEIIYGAAISCCRKAQEPERALLLLRKMISEKLSPNTALFNTVIASLADGKPDSKTTKNDLLWEKALAVYKVMRSKSAGTDVTPNRQTYNILVRCLSVNLQPGYAESVLNDMRNAGFVPDVNLYTMTVRSYEKCGNPMKALGLMEAMREVGYDFYGIKVLDDAFKNGVRILNRVGRGISTVDDIDYDIMEDRQSDISYALGEEMIDFDDDDEDDFQVDYMTI